MGGFGDRGVLRGGFGERILILMVENKFLIKEIRWILKIDKD